MRQQAMGSRMVFNRAIPVNRLVNMIADKAQVNTQEYGRRPYGVGFLIIGQDQSGPHLYEFSPSGTAYEYYAMSIGARSQSAKTYLEKKYESFEDGEDSMDLDSGTKLSLHLSLSKATLDELINHGLHALRETLQQDKELTNLNTSIGIVGPRGESEKGTAIKGGGAFRILQDDKVDVYLSRLEPKENTTTAAAPTGGDEDVSMDG
ncbi:hypothetical protein FRC00_011923 [Tulasnella sp. 408]|nr:hypothetical protein FRC00_011923 [Tulasnella sp. 408]